MKEELTQDDIKEILTRIKDVIIDNSDYLCELDSVVGDGDHGTTIARGVKAGFKNMQEEEANNIMDLLSNFSMEMVDSMGGASGPLFGSFFRGLALGCKNKETIDPETLHIMFDKGLEKVKTLGKAEPGDKTFVDSLQPATEAMAEAKASLSESLTAAHKAALEGLEKTKEMTAAKGRSRYAGDRGRGHQDAGATSITLIIQAFNLQVNTEAQEGQNS
jgi:dihydroxyacetone kinase-like protein